MSLRHLLSSVVSIARKKLCCLSGGIKLRQFNQSQKISFCMQAYQSVTLVLYKRESRPKKKKLPPQLPVWKFIWIRVIAEGQCQTNIPQSKQHQGGNGFSVADFNLKPAIRFSFSILSITFFSQTKYRTGRMWEEIGAKFHPFTCCTWPLSPGECVSQLSDWEQPRGRVFVHLWRCGSPNPH